MTQAKLVCPECESTDIHIEGYFEGFSIDQNSDTGKIMAMQFEDESRQDAEIGCNNCSSKLKLTKSGLKKI